MNGHSVCRRSEYDVIIAGGGTAGSVVATRLAETTDLNILLLEAGGNHNEDPRIKIPAMFSQAIGDPSIDWTYRTVPQPELNSREIMQARGMELGGSSLINLLGLLHPSKTDFDAWAKVGNDGWDWKSVSPYLKKFQTFHMPDEKVIEDPNLHNIDINAQGRNGPIQTSYQSVPHTLDKAWIKTFKNMGHAMSADTISGENIGGYQITSSIDPVKRERSHTGQAYLDRVRDKPNLEIMTNILVDMVIFSSTNPPKASGIRFIQDRHAQTATATREVILCSGVFGTSTPWNAQALEVPDCFRVWALNPLVVNENVWSELARLPDVLGFVRIER